MATVKVKERKDFIRGLKKRQIQSYIAYDILGLLDVKCLSNAEMVSQTWKEAIFQGKLWKKLFERKVLVELEWKRMNEILKHSPSYYFAKPNKLSLEEYDAWLHKKYCFLIQKSLEALDSNWRCGDKKGNFFSQHVNDRSDSYATDDFEMGENYLVRHIYNVDGGSCFRIFNRWTLELKNTIMLQDDYSNCLISQNLFAAGCDDYSEVHVWNLNSDIKAMPQLHALDDSLNWPINLNYDEEGNPIDWQFYIWKLSFSPKARYLASIMRAENETDDRYLLTLREFTSMECVTTRGHYVFPSLDRMLQLVVDESYVVVKYSYCNSSEASNSLGATDNRSCVVEVRSTLTFEKIHSIFVGDYNSSNDFRCSNGFFICSLRNVYLRIWDIESGTSVASFGNPSIVSLCDFNYVVNLYSSIIARKYVIGFSNEGFFKVWDLNTMIQKDKASNASIALGISSLWSYRMPKFLTLEKILVDEYQLYVYGRTKFKNSGCLFVLDLISALNPDKKPRLERVYQRRRAERRSRRLQGLQP